MKIRIECNKCRLEGIPYEKACTYQALSDKGLYKIVCDAGHESVVFIENHKFEILFESGIMALIDGYSREAVSSIASSLERFYEFYVKIICLKNGVYYDKIIANWKKVAAQAERQFGAFIFVYLMENKNPPKTLSNKLVKFRNKVIHRGYIPSDNEVIKYAKNVGEIISVEYLKLKNNNKDLHQYTIAIGGMESGVFDEENDDISTMDVSTVLTRMIHGHRNKEYCFESDINQLKGQQKSILLNK